jgi:hypothetical protein
MSVLFFDEKCSRLKVHVCHLYLIDIGHDSSLGPVRSLDTRFTNINKVFTRDQTTNHEL